MLSIPAAFSSQTEAPEWRTLCNSIVECIQSDDPELLHQYLDADALRLTALDSDQNSLLMILLMGNAVECACTLLKQHGNKVDVKQQNVQRRSALHYAVSCKTEKTQEALEVITLLLKREVRVTDKDVHGLTPVHIAIREHNFDALCLMEPTVATSDRSAFFETNTTTCLHLAAKSSHQMLITVAKFTTDFNIVDEQQMTALHHSISGLEAYKSAEFLLSKHANPNIVDAFGRTALTLACLAQNPALVSLLLQNNAQANGGTPQPLVVCYLVGNPTLAKALPQESIDHNIKIDSVSVYDVAVCMADTEFQQILHKAQKTALTATLSQCQFRNVTFVRPSLSVMQLLAPKRNTFDSSVPHRLAKSDASAFERQKTTLTLDQWEATDSYGRSALYISAQSGTVEQCYRLLQLGVNAFTRDSEGNNLLMAALEGRNTLVFCFLLRHLKELVKETNRKGDTPLHLAVRTGNVLAVKLLLEAGADPKAPNSLRRTPLHLVPEMASDEMNRVVAITDMLLLKGASLESQDANQHTPLWIAYFAPQTLFFEYLLARGANPDAPDREGMTLLTRCSSLGNGTRAELLLLYDADKNLKGKTSALNEACRIGNLELVKLLFRPTERRHKPLDPNSRVNGVSPVSIVLEGMNNSSREMAAKLDRLATLHTSRTSMVEVQLDSHQKQKHPSAEVDEKERSRIQNTLQNEMRKLQHYSETLRAILELLSLHGATLNKSIFVAGKKFTPLCYSVQNSLLETASLLLSRNVRVNKVVSGCEAAIVSSAKLGFKDLVRALLDRGAKVSTDLATLPGLKPDIVQMLKEAKPVKDTKLFRTLSWDKTRRTIHKSDTQLVTGLQAIRLGPKTPIEYLDPTSSSVPIVRQGHELRYRIELQDSLVRAHAMLTGDPLLQQKPRLIPLSMCRLGNTMQIVIGTKILLDRTTLLPEATRDLRAQFIARLLLTDIHTQLGLTMESAPFTERIILLTKMDTMDEQKLEDFVLYNSDGAFRPGNWDIVALKLITKEGACLALGPVQRLISHYPKRKLIPKPNRDQWEKIALNFAVQRGEIVAQASTQIGIEYQSGVDEKRFGGKVTVEAILTARPVKKEVYVDLTIRDLCYAKGTPEDVMQDMYAAMTQPLTYDTFKSTTRQLP